MNPPTVSVLEHYERCIDEGIDPCQDDPQLRRYMARWDGPRFFELLGALAGRDVLEVGVGTGRLARQVLAWGCRTFTGLDLSPRTVARARYNLNKFENVELLETDIADFRRPDAYDIAYSVLTFMHIPDKRTALANIVASLRPGGCLILSIDRAGPWLDFGTRRIMLHPAAPAAYEGWLAELGCDVEPPVPLIDTWVNLNGSRSATYGQPIATLLRANRV